MSADFFEGNPQAINIQVKCPPPPPTIQQFLVKAYCK